MFFYTCLLTLPAIGQNEDLRYFVADGRPTCDSVYDIYRDSVLQIQPLEDPTALKEMQQSWREFCSPSEEILRLEILLDHALKRQIPAAADFRSYFPYYLATLRNHAGFIHDSAEYRFLRYTARWADSLKSEQEHLQLALLSAFRRQEVLQVLYGDAYWHNPEAKALRELLEDDQWQTFSGIGLGFFQMVGPAQKFIGSSPHLNLFAGYGRWRPWRFDLGMQLQFYNFTQEGRFNRTDSVFRKKPSFGFNIYLKASPRLWSSRLQEIRGSVSAGLETMSVVTDDPETNFDESLSIPAFNLGVGLEYNLRIRIKHQIGLSAQLHLVNFSSGQVSLDNLNGPYLNFGIHYR